MLLGAVQFRLISSCMPFGRKSPEGAVAFGMVAKVACEMNDWPVMAMASTSKR